MTSKGVCQTELASGLVELAHGAGGLRSQQLIERIFRRSFSQTALPARRTLTDGLEHDASVLPCPGGNLALTTDGYVVSPLFFPGGDIGSLAVTGTLNDLAVVGAAPVALTASFILEEGLPRATLQEIAESMAATAAEAGIPIAGGDTKVVENGRGDGVYISTSGLGSVPDGLHWRPSAIHPGDCILLSGDIGRHGLTILCAREGLELRGNLISDCALLWPAISQLIPHASAVHCLRDVTRGGLAITLNELAKSSGLRFELEQDAIPVSPEVRSSCELLGLDPLYAACEGRFVVLASADAADELLRVLRSEAVSRDARVIGHVAQDVPEAAGGQVVVRTPLGSNRVLDWRGAEQMPRIC